MILSLGSCETVDFGDMNDNPNGPTEFDSAALLTAAQRRFVSIGFRNWLANPTLYVQYQAQPVYQDESLYAPSPVEFAPFYVQTLQNLQQIIELANDPEVNTSPNFLANGSIANQIAVAKIMKVIIFKRLTDTYGAIPYFEALNASETQTPAYTSQEEIYADFVSELREARDLLNPSQDGVAGDVIYDGDVEAWQRYANSLLLSVAITMSEAPSPPVSPKEVFMEALNNEYGVIDEVSEEAWYQPINVSTLVNPWTTFRDADYNLSEYFQDALQGDNPLYSNEVFDSRLLIYSSDAAGPGLIYGLASYAGVPGSNVRISEYVTSPLTPFPWFTSANTWLDRAEAAVRGWTNEDPAEMLREGIIHSYASTTEYFGMGPHTGTGDLEPISIVDEAEEFAASRVADAEATGYLQVIGEEKWAALFPQGFKAWTEWRRLDWPNLVPAPDALNNGEIPTRYIYPVTEINLNNANYLSGVSLLIPAQDLNTANVWWDVD